MGVFNKLRNWNRGSNAVRDPVEGVVPDGLVRQRLLRIGDIGGCLAGR